MRLTEVLNTIRAEFLEPTDRVGDLGALLEAEDLGTMYRLEVAIIKDLLPREKPARTPTAAFLQIRLHNLIKEAQTEMRRFTCTK